MNKVINHKGRAYIYISNEEMGETVEKDWLYNYEDEIAPPKIEWIGKPAKICNVFPNYFLKPFGVQRECCLPPTGAERKPRDPKRIPKILDALEIYWEKQPDMRLGQLVFAFASMDKQMLNPFYYEDDDLLAFLEAENHRQFLKESENKGLY